MTDTSDLVKRLRDWPPHLAGNITTEAADEIIKEAEQRGQIKAGGVFVNDGSAEDRYCEDAEIACPCCGGSGHKDDASNAIAKVREDALRDFQVILSADHTHWAEVEALETLNNRKANANQAQARMNTISTLTSKLQALIEGKAQ